MKLIKKAAKNEGSRHELSQLSNAGTSLWHKVYNAYLWMYVRQWLPVRTKMRTDLQTYKVLVTDYAG